MKAIILLLILWIASSSLVYCQVDSDILFQYSGQSITIRKSKENNPMYYSEKHDKLLTYKEELAIFPDSVYRLVKPKMVIFSAKSFETDTKEQINIRVDYSYQQPNGKLTVIERWSKSYYPSIQKIIKMQDTRETDGKVTFTMDDKSVWIVETEKDGSTSLYYITQKENSFLNYGLLFPNCKKEIENGNRL